MIIKKIKHKISQLRCKHKDVVDASCPFTGMTYSTCAQCQKTISVLGTEF